MDTKIGDFQNSLHQTLTWFLSPKSKLLEQEGRHLVKMIAGNIANGYKNLTLEGDVSFKDKISIQVPELNSKELLSKDEDYLKAVLELREFASLNLLNYLSDFLIHGSIATLDYSKGWSDLDTFLIIKKEVVRNNGLLMELREQLITAYHFLLDIDALQHHGFILCSEMDMESYPSFYMPVEVLRYSKSLFGKNTLSFNTVDVYRDLKYSFRSRVELFKNAFEKGVLEHHAYKGEYLLSAFRNANNAMYQLKYYLGIIMMLPCYYLEIKGKPCYKKYSFVAVRPVVPANLWAVVEKSSKIRELWQKDEVFPCRSNKIPLWVQEILGKDYFQEGYEFISVLAEQLEIW